MTVVLYLARTLAGVLRRRPPAQPHHSIPLCPTCQRDVRTSGAQLDDDALDGAGARGRTWRCSCGTRSRWEMSAPPILLAWLAPVTPREPAH